MLREDRSDHLVVDLIIFVVVIGVRAVRFAVSLFAVNAPVFRFEKFVDCPVAGIVARYLKR